MRIKEVMKEKHLTQQELAGRMGISLSGAGSLNGNVINCPHCGKPIKFDGV